MTETDFFRRINEADNHNELHPAYRDFTDKVIRLCIEGMDIHRAILALTYAETELQFHHKLSENEANSISGLYIRKALAFVRKTQKIPYPTSATTIRIHPRNPKLRNPKIPCDGQAKPQTLSKCCTAWLKWAVSMAGKCP